MFRKAAARLQVTSSVKPGKGSRTNAELSRAPGPDAGPASPQHRPTPFGLKSSSKAPEYSSPSASQGWLAPRKYFYVPESVLADLQIRCLQFSFRSQLACFPFSLRSPSRLVSCSSPSSDPGFHQPPPPKKPLQPAATSAPTFLTAARGPPALRWVPSPQTVVGSDLQPGKGKGKRKGKGERGRGKGKGKGEGEKERERGKGKGKGEREMEGDPPLALTGVAGSRTPVASDSGPPPCPDRTGQRSLSAGPGCVPASPPYRAGPGILVGTGTLHRQDAGSCPLGSTPALGFFSPSP